MEGSRPNHQTGIQLDLACLDKARVQKEGVDLTSTQPAIETAVTRLLVSIKALLETLTAWSKGAKTENDVSDVYVRLGNDFNAAAAAFGSFKIDMSELLSVPDELREVLEQCLSEEASQQTLEIYLTDVRKIITKLLQGLRGKQSIYRRIVSDAKDRSSTSEGSTSRPESRTSRSSRRDTSASTVSTKSEHSHARDTLLNSDSGARRSTASTRRPPSATPMPQPQGPLPPPPMPTATEPFIGGFAPDINQRSSTSSQPDLHHRASTPHRREWSDSGQRPPSRAASASAVPSDHQKEQAMTPHAPVPRPPSVISQVPSHVKRYSLVDRPVSSPTPPPVVPTPPPAVVVDEVPGTNGHEPTHDANTPTPPPSFLDSPPPDAPAVQSSLAALKQSDALERRASKRFSTYNISKMTGSSTRGMNRRSMAVSSALSPGDLAVLTEETEDEPTPRKRDRSKGSQRSRGPSPIAEAEEDESEPIPPVTTPARGPSPAHVVQEHKELPPPPTAQSPQRSPTPQDRPTGPFPVFLQLGREVKKVTVEPGLSYSSLRVLFVDKFSYSPGQDNFPAIYIRDPSSGVQYELEDMDEVKEKCLLSLNVEPLDQIKQHIDMQITALSQDIKDLRTVVSNTRRNSLPPPVIIGQPLPDSTPQAARPTDRQFRNVARRLSRMIPEDDVTPRTTPEPILPQLTGTTIQPQMTGASVMSDYSARVVSDLKTQFDEVQNLRRDLGIMRQLYTDFVKQTKDAMQSLRTQTQNVRQLATVKVGGARAYIDDGKTKLDARSQTVLTKMEELQDTVEAIKDDVLKRNISPRPQVLKNIKAECDAIAAELESLKDHMQTVKPMWKKTWAEELQNIVEEQQFFSHQEELLGDLLEDHKAVMEVYGHVEKVISLRGSSSARGKGRTFKPPPPEEGHNGLSTVLLEIRGSSVDPERRMKAIAANEKLREKEIKNRPDEFQSELSGFVSGKKLKLTGGAEEVERVRQKKNDMTLKAMFTGSSATSSTTSPVPSPSLITDKELPSPTSPSA
ncbi:hypothetical protein EIP86_001137 [Pleurotus ostreatoroseus]|nr:hypothetical protein EIP86_001137 [Pleurotus ostreatoroseus]